MILVDTSIWVDYLRRGDNILVQLLTKEQVCIHPMIIGELSCGHLQHRGQLMSLWGNLPHVTEASNSEALHCLNTHDLMGRGIGFIDLHLLASVMLSSGTQLWTRNRRLYEVAHSLGIAFTQA